MASSGVMDGSVAAVLGALSGGLVSWLVSWRAEARINRQRVWEKLTDVLDDLEAHAAIYWRTSGIDVEKEKWLIELLERLDVRLEAQLRQISDPNVSVAVRGQLDVLSDLVTGGDFQVSSRAADGGRVAEIKECVRRIRDALAAS